MPRARNTGRRLIKPRRGMVWDKKKMRYVTPVHTEAKDD